MATRILHVSDLHVGARHDPVVEQALHALAERIRPDLVVASGDLTHRGRREQHEGAAGLLRSLELPLLVVPGNHDIPYSFPARFTRPWREFDLQWGTTEPVHEDAGAVVVGLNSVRPWRHQSGGLSPSQLERAEVRLRDAADGTLRMVVLHHQLVNAPWRTRKRPVADRGTVLERLVAAGAELVVGGHVHQCTVAERREFEVASGEPAAAVLTTAPGLGQPRPHRRGEARGCLVYRVDASTIVVDTLIWSGDWGLTATRTFPRGREPLAAST